MNNPIDKAFNNFMKQAETLRKKEETTAQINEKIILEKDKILQPIRDLLKRFVDLGVWVYDKNKFERTLPKSDGDKLPPQLFATYEDPSSPRWKPGFSLYIEHPAEIEIAVPDAKDRDKLGLIVISCKENPYSGILDNRIFKDVDSACMAISDFLSKNLVKVGRNNDSSDDGISLKK